MRSSTVDGLKGSAQVTSLCAIGSWIAYGLMQGLSVQVATNVVAAVGVLVILGVGIRTQAFSPLNLIAGGTVYVVLTTMLALNLGAAGIALAASTVFFVARLPEVVEAWRRPGGQGISVAANTMMVVQSILWTTYGALHADPWIIATSVYAVLQTIFIVVRTVQGRTVVKETQPVYEIETAPTMPMPRLQVDAA